MTSAVVPDATGHFGRYGGRFVPEALVAAIDELTAAFHATQADPAFRAELSRLLRDYTGRPSPLTDAGKFGEHAGGARILLKREDLNHTGSHKINNVLGQALLTRRIGKKRVIAETGAGQHGVATATAAALLGLECTVYMGEEDTRRQALNVAAHAAARRDGRAGATGSRTLKDAINEAMRDWVTNVDTTNYVFGTVAGPHPFPLMVREFQRVIGDEARAQVLERDRPVAGRGRRLRRRRLERDRHLHRVRARRRASGWSASRPAATASTPAGTRPRSPAARRACCTARGPTCCRTRTGRPSSRTRSRPAWTTPASARSTPTCTTSAGPSTAPITDAEAMAAFALLSRTEGIIPAIESRARAGRRAGSSAASSARTPSSWSTCPAAATRTWRPRPAYFGLAAAERTSRDRARRRPGQGPGRRSRRADRLPAGRLPVGRRLDRGDARDGRRRRRRHRGRRAVQRPGDGRPDHPGRGRAGGPRRASAWPMRCAAVAAVAEAGAACRW